MDVEVTVALSVHDSEKCIHSCIESLLAQTNGSFEILVVEDPPFDRTQEMINVFQDKRIRYFRNQRHLGIPGTRNKCIELAKGNYIFFTDDDCVVSRDWIEQGLKFLAKLGSVGVEGKTYYVCETYKPGHSDEVVENKKGGQFMTCNMAYKKRLLESVGGFDERFDYHEDRDLGLRASRLGRIYFNPKMVVCHRKKTLNPVQFVRTGERIKNRVLLYKRFKERSLFVGRIAYPLDLMAMIFPPLILGSFFRNGYRTREDINLFPFIYIKLVYERFNLWKMCAKERVFLL